MHSPGALLLAMLTGDPMTTEERRALTLFVLTLARRVRELEASPAEAYRTHLLGDFPPTTGDTERAK